MTSNSFCYIISVALLSATVLVGDRVSSSTRTEHQPQLVTTAPFREALKLASRESFASSRSRCRTSQLSVRPVSGDAGVGNRAITYAFTNTSTSSCTLYGYPGFALLDAKGKPLKGINIIRSQITYFQTVKPIRKVILAPGAQASFQIGYNVANNCPESAKIQITPPNAYNHFTLAEHIRPCKELVVTPVQAGIIH